jgi:hypothetical protein
MMSSIMLQELNKTPIHRAHCYTSIYWTCLVFPISITLKIEVSDIMVLSGDRAFYVIQFR